MYLYNCTYTIGKMATKTQEFYSDNIQSFSKGHYCGHNGNICNRVVISH